MKKYIITIILALGMLINVSAQGDGFFAYSSNDSRGGTSSGWGTAMPLLPNSYTATDNFNANTPLGSGIILLAGMAFAYGLRKKNRD